MIALHIFGLLAVYIKAFFFLGNFNFNTIVFYLLPLPLIFPICRCCWLVYFILSNLLLFLHRTFRKTLMKYTILQKGHFLENQSNILEFLCLSNAGRRTTLLAYILYCSVDIINKEYLFFNLKTNIDCTLC